MERLFTPETILQEGSRSPSVPASAHQSESQQRGAAEQPKADRPQETEQPEADRLQETEQPEDDETTERLEKELNPVK